MLRKLSKQRENKGFTLIELLVVVIIIGILAAIALPNFIGAQDKARNASVKANMRTAQIAAESYATDNGGTYPAAINDAYKSYFPGGSNDGKTAAAAGPVNPFNNTAEFPILGAVADVVATRGGAPTALTKGKVEYSVVGGGNSYAIRGGGSNDLALVGIGGSGTTLVLSNM